MNRNYLSLIFLIFIFSCQNTHQQMGTDYPDTTFPDGLPASSFEMKWLIEEMEKNQQLFEALSISDSLNDLLSLANIKINLSESFRSSGNYYAGLQFLNEIMDMDNIHLPDNIMMNIYEGFSSIYYEMFFHNKDQIHYLDSSYSMAQQYLSLAKKLNNDSEEAIALNLLGACYLQKENYNEASRLLNQSYLMKQNLGNSSTMAVLNNLAYVNYKMENYEQALEFAEKVYTEALNNEHLVFTGSSLEMMARIYDAKGDSINGDNARRNIDQLKQKKDVYLNTLLVKQQLMEYEKKHDHKTILGLYNERIYFLRLSRILIIAFISSILIFFFFAYFFKQKNKLRATQLKLIQSRHHSNQLEIKNIRLELMKKEAEHKVMQSEIDSQKKLMVAKMISLTHLNAFLNKIKNEINKKRREAKKMISLGFLKGLEQQINQEVDSNIWEEFEVLYTSGNNSFIELILEKHPDLTANEKRLCYLVMMGFDTKEISDLLSKSIRSIEMARHRLRKKLNIERESNMQDYLQSFIGK